MRKRTRQHVGCTRSGERDEREGRAYRPPRARCIVNSHAQTASHGNLDLVCGLIIKFRDLDQHFWKLGTDGAVMQVLGTSYNPVSKFGDLDLQC